MPVNWLDVTHLSFNMLLLLERVQLGWFPGWVPEAELGVALRANPVVEWYLRHKCPELCAWLDSFMPAEQAGPPRSLEETRSAEIAVLRAVNDLVVYAVAPEVYDAQPFLNWDPSELTSLVDFTGKIVVDVGAGTGRLAFIVAPQAYAVFAVEPVENLRRFMRGKALRADISSVHPVDGLITALPFPDCFADVVMGGHVFGDDPAGEYREMARVTKPGGTLILCPGNNDVDNEIHRFLIEHAFEWSRFEEPGDGPKRKYWKRIC